MSIETMTKLATQTVGAGGSSTITFSNIPQTYTDLVVYVSARSSYSATQDYMLGWVNGDRSLIYSDRRLEGNGSAASSTANSSQNNFNVSVYPGATATASTFGSVSLYFPNYTSGNYKSISTDSVAENNATAATADLFAQLYSSTLPITSISIYPGNGNFVQYSTFTLYGVKAYRNYATSITATGGNTVTFDGTYYVHTFTSSGTFTPNNNLTAEYLVVAGGGGSGSSGSGNGGSGGGGAGGYRTNLNGTLLPLFKGIPYTVTVGAGGTGGSSGTSSDGTSGSNSVFASITSTGGGYSGGATSRSSASGGSGGGGSFNKQAGGAGNAGSYSPVEGYAGGTANVSNYVSGAGGGGSAGVGGNAATFGGGGAGGSGTANTITGSSVTYAGGGGGGGYDNTGNATSVSGGGGAGSTSTNTSGSAGTANTGGGGGGCYAVAAGTSGGSGVVIVRYKALQ